MKLRTVLCAMTASVLLPCGVAWASAPPCAVDAPESVPAKGPFVRSSVDPVTGATIVLRREASGVVTIKLKDKTVTVRKTLDRGTSTTAFASGNQRLVVTVKGDQVVVTTPGGTWEGGPRSMDTLNPAAAYFQKSATAIAVKRLLDRAVLRPDSLEGNALLLTRALLGSFFGDGIGAAQHQQWARATMTRAKVLRAVAASGPGECWDQYAAESIRIADDYTDCANSCHWSGMFCMAGCGFLYEVRAEGAFMWYMRCSGGFYVN